MASDKESKTEDPTQRRLQDAEKKGDIPRSKDLVSAISLVSILLFFALFVPFMGSTLIAFCRKYFGGASELVLTDASIFIVGKDFFYAFLKIMMPLFLLLFVIVVLMEVVQGGSVRIIGSNLHIKWEKLNILAEIPKGLKKILISAEALMELGKSILKVIAIGFIAYFVIAGIIPDLLRLPDQSLSDILKVMGSVFFKLTAAIAIFLLILSVADYLWQKFRYKKRLKMSKQDVKDEFKQTEGDPQIKSKQRQIQFQWAMRRMMAEVPEADVVITNPTHYAVALKYEFKKMQSPQLVAKGQNLIAENIKELAREHHVPIVENPPLARAIFTSVEINEFIPEKLFKPVAEILAYIYKLKGKKVG